MIKKIDKYIEIVRARDVGFSSMGLKSGLMIKDVLSKYYKHVGLSTVGSYSDLEQLVTKQPDLVFLGLKRIEDTGKLIWLSEYLDSYGINYSGSEKSAMELDLNKADAKLLMQHSGIATAEFFTSQPGQHTTEVPLPLNFPVFIKPHDQGGGVGIGPDSIARDFPAFEKKVQSIFDSYGAFSLVETYLEGREFSVALLGSGYSEDLLAMPIELITQPDEFGNRILGQAVKAEDNERAVFIKEDSVRTQVADLGRAIYQTLGGRDYGRIDIRMDGEGTPCFIEANLTPGIAHNDFISYFTRACQLNQQMNYETMILKIVELGLARSSANTEDLFELNELGNSPYPTLEPAFEPV